MLTHANVADVGIHVPGGKKAESKLKAFNLCSTLFPAFKLSVSMSPLSRVQRSLRVLQELLRREASPDVLSGSTDASPVWSLPPLPPPLPPWLKCAISHSSVKQTVGRRTCDPLWHLSSFRSQTCKHHYPWVILGGAAKTRSTSSPRVCGWGGGAGPAGGGWGVARR